MHGHWEWPNSWTVTRGQSPDFFGRDANFTKSCGNKEWGGWSRSQKEWEDYKGEDESEDEDGESLLGDASFEAEMSNQG